MLQFLSYCTSETEDVLKKNLLVTMYSEPPARSYFYLLVEYLYLLRKMRLKIVLQDNNDISFLDSDEWRKLSKSKM